MLDALDIEAHRLWANTGVEVALVEMPHPPGVARGRSESFPSNMASGGAWSPSIPESFRNPRLTL